MNCALFLEVAGYLILFGVTPAILEARRRFRQPREGREGAASSRAVPAPRIPIWEEKP
jgi:hypothetical protein